MDLPCLNLHHIFTEKALDISINFLNPRPPSSIRQQALDQLTQWALEWLEK